MTWSASGSIVRMHLPRDAHRRSLERSSGKTCSARGADTEATVTHRAAQRLSHTANWPSPLERSILASTATLSAGARQDSESIMRSHKVPCHTTHRRTVEVAARAGACTSRQTGDSVSVICKTICLCIHNVHGPWPGHATSKPSAGPAPVCQQVSVSTQTRGCLRQVRTHTWAWE